MAHAGSFRGLRVYKKAFETSHALFERSKSFPSNEQFALTGQLRRSSRAVCALIAEAWYHRRYPRSFVSKLVQALGESAETQVWLDFSLKSGFITKEEHSHFDESYDHIGAMLYQMISHPAAFTGPRNAEK